MRRNVFKVLLGILAVLIIVGLGNCDTGERAVGSSCGHPTEEEKEGWVTYEAYKYLNCIYGTYNDLWMGIKEGTRYLLHFDGENIHGYSAESLGLVYIDAYFKVNKITFFKNKVYFDIIQQGLLEYNSGNWNLYSEKEGVFTSTDSVLWIWSRKHKFLYKFDGAVFDSIIDSTITDSFTSVETDKRGRVWLGSENGLVYYDGSFHRLTSSPGNLKCNRILKDRNNALWFTMNDSALYKLDSDNLTFTKPYDIPELARGLRAFDLNNNFWVILDNGGVGKFDGQEWVRYYGYYRRYRGDDTDCDPRGNSGLASSTVVSIYVDDLNNKWIGTDGLSVYSK